MELLEIKEEKLKIIHVAGTNGKGSTCAYMNSILCGMGRNVGLFTSPHLENMTERIRMNGLEISREEFAESYSEVMHAIEQMKAEGLPHPSFFEFLLGMAMKSFVMNNMEYVILETGLGGRLDATNVFIKPLVTIITSIGLDHEAYLGDTIEKIAQEKAGIIKKNIPVVYDGNCEEVCNVIENKARKYHCKCKKISYSAYEIIEKNEKDIAFCMKDGYDETVTWKIRNKGLYQVDNAALAICALQLIVDNTNQDIQSWREAIYQMVWPGRMEELKEGIFLDGAHNVAAIERISEDIHEVDVLLFSAVEDKNYREMIRIIADRIKVESYIVTTIQDKRAVPASELAKILENRVQKPVYVMEEIEEAWELLSALKSERGKALCIGSLYLIGTIKEIDRNKQ